MIQRIQSLYLLLVIILLFVMFFLPFAVFNDGAGSITHLSYKGIVKITPVEWVTIKANYTITAILFISIVSTLTTLFFFKNRKSQVVTGWITIIVLLIFSIFIFYQYQWIRSHFGIVNSNLNLATIFPVVSIIFTYLAIQSINKDEKLVRSMDRIR